MSLDPRHDHSMPRLPFGRLKHGATHHSTTVVQIELRLRAHLPSLNLTLKTRLGIEHVSVWADMGSDSRDQVVRMPPDTLQHRTPPLTHTVSTEEEEFAHCSLCVCICVQWNKSSAPGQHGRERGPPCSLSQL